MSKNTNRNHLNWEKKRRRVKNQLIIGSRPRLVVYRSNLNIYAQIVDDKAGNTIVSASTIDKELRSACADAKNKVERSALVGKALGERAVAQNVDKVIFDRNGYKFHGRVKALANAAREAGLQF